MKPCKCKDKQGLYPNNDINLIQANWKKKIAVYKDIMPVLLISGNFIVFLVCSNRLSAQ